MLKFKVNGEEVPFEIEGKSGKKDDYTLVELSAADRDTCLASTREAVGDDASEAEITQKVGHLQSLVLSHTIRDSTGKKIATNVISKWPATVVGTLFKESQRINGLGDDNEPVPNE